MIRDQFALPRSIRSAIHPRPFQASKAATGSRSFFHVTPTRLQWWKQTISEPELLENVPAAHLASFSSNTAAISHLRTSLKARRYAVCPTINSASFVDAGLMPYVERESGEAISNLVERVIKGMEKSLGRHVRTDAEVDAVYKSTFWLLAAKLLQEKRGPRNFITIKLEDIDDVFRRVGLHYGDTNGLPPGGPSWRNAITQAAQTIDQFHLPGWLTFLLMP